MRITSRNFLYHWSQNNGFSYVKSLVNCINGPGSSHYSYPHQKKFPKMAPTLRTILTEVRLGTERFGPWAFAHEFVCASGFSPWLLPCGSLGLSFLDQGPSALRPKLIMPFSLERLGCDSLVCRFGLAPLTFRSLESWVLCF